MARANRAMDFMMCCQSDGWAFSGAGCEGGHLVTGHSGTPDRSDETERNFQTILSTELHKTLIGT